MKEQMLKNAGVIQYFMNIIANRQDDENVWLERYGVECEYELTVGEYYESSQKWQLEPWIFRFLIKQRNLHSGLATPMARRLAWKALERG